MSKTYTIYLPESHPYSLFLGDRLFVPRPDVLPEPGQEYVVATDRIVAMDKDGSVGSAVKGTTLKLIERTSEATRSGLKSELGNWRAKVCEPGREPLILVFSVIEGYIALGDLVKVDEKKEEAKKSSRPSPLLEASELEKHCVEAARAYMEKTYGPDPNAVTNPYMVDKGLLRDVRAILVGGVSAATLHRAWRKRKCRANQGQGNASMVPFHEMSPEERANWYGFRDTVLQASQQFADAKEAFSHTKKPAPGQVSSRTVQDVANDVLKIVAAGFRPSCIGTGHNYVGYITSDKLRKLVEEAELLGYKR